MPKLNYNRATGKARLPGTLPTSPKPNVDEDMNAIGKLSTAKRFSEWRKSRKHRTFADANAFIAREIEQMRSDPHFKDQFKMPWHKP
jgi:hypothetical protein